MSNTPMLLRPVKIYFTPSEANALLPNLMPDIDALSEGVVQARELNEVLAGESDPARRAAIARDLDELHLDARDALGRIQSHGVEIKGLDPALLDFPALHRGNEALLCWCEGEETITHWHPVHTGFAGRTPIDDEPDSAWEYCS